MTKKIFPLIGFLTMTTALLNAQKLSISKGQKVEMITNSKMSLKMDMMGQSIESNSESTVTANSELKDVSDKGFLFINTLKHMVMHAGGMGQEVNFDSDKKEDMDGQLGEAVKDQIGKPKEILVNKQGKVIEMSDTSKSGMEGLGQLMNMGNELSKGQAYPLLAQLPDKTVKIGDSWTETVGTPETLKTVTTYTLKEIKGDDMVLSFTGTVAKSGTLQQQQMEIQMDLNGTSNGEAVYEKSTGILKKSTTNSDIKGTIGVMGQNAPLNMTMTISTTANKL